MTTSELINQAVNKQPIDFASTFNNVLVNKIAEKIAAFKDTVAQDMFNTPEQADYEETTEQDAE